MANVITGTTSADILTGNDENDIINGLDGDDEIHSWGGHDYVYGGQGNDTIISSGSGKKYLNGNTGNDHFKVSGILTLLNDITIIGGDGNDTAEASISSTVTSLESFFYFDGGDGDDSLNVTLSSNAGFSFKGGQGNDFLKVTGSGFRDIMGGAGNDTYDILGDTTNLEFAGLEGGPDTGIDTVIWRGGSLPPSADLFVENLILAVQVHGVSVFLNELNNVMTGSAFNDTLDGRAGNDTLDGGAGGDILDGGADFDTVTYLASSVGVNINLAGDIGSGGLAAGDRVFGCEYLIGSNFSDSLGGGIVNSTIEGLAGNDTVDGGIGNNIINGGAGADSLVGREGNDTFLISGAEGLGDTMVGGTGTDTLRVLGTTAIALAGFSAAVTSIENWVGNNKAVLGTASADVFNFAALTTKSGLLFVDGAGGNDAITASNLADDLRGGAGNDTLNGGSGSDTLAGGLGNDVLTGGAGSDHFVFNTTLSATTNRDAITDFTAIHDTIRLENSIFSGLGAATGALSSGKFWASNTGLAHDADDRIVYNKVTGVLTYDSNGSAAGGVVAFATLTTKPALTSADFFVI